MKKKSRASLRRDPINRSAIAFMLGALVDVFTDQIAEPDFLLPQTALFFLSCVLKLLDNK